MERSIKQIITDAGASARISLGILKRQPEYLPSKISKQLINIEKSLDEINLACAGLEENEEDIIFTHLSMMYQRQTLEEELLQVDIKKSQLQEKLDKYFYTVTIPDFNKELNLEDGVCYGRYVTHKGDTITFRVPMDMITLSDFYSFIKRNMNEATERMFVNGKMLSKKELLKLLNK